MLWFDEFRNDPPVIFVLFRGTIKSLEIVSNRFISKSGSHRQMGKLFATLADGTEIRWRYPFDRDDPGVPPLEKEIIVWRHSYTDAYLHRITLATEWDSLIESIDSHNVIEEKAIAQKLLIEYHEAGGQLSLMVGSNYALYYAISDGFNVMIPRERYKGIGTLRELVSLVHEYSSELSLQDIWNKMTSLLMQEIGCLPNEIHQDMEIKIFVERPEVRAYFPGIMSG